MLVVTIARTEPFTSPHYIAPFTVRQLFSYDIDPWWFSTFGAPDESSTPNPPVVLSVKCDNEGYALTSTEADCIDTEKSWFKDGTGYSAHLNHSVVWEGVTFNLGVGSGYTDSGVVYIDNSEYLPLITQAPSIESSEDIVGYSKIRLINGSVELSNISGIADYLKTQDIVGNFAILSHLPDSSVTDGVASSTDVTDLFRYVVQSASIGNSNVSFELKDIRGTDKKIPTRFIDDITYPFVSDTIEGKVVPIAYGLFRDLGATAVTSMETGTTSATYRACEFLTTLSEVRVKVAETWETRTPSSTDLANGVFTIPNARASAGKEPYECRVDGLGIPVTNAPDIIVDLYERYLNQSFTSTFYDTTAWTANKASIPTCGLVIKETTSILDVIPTIQNGVYPSFRFDITPQGLRTIALDDRERAVDWTVDSIEILNVDELEFIDSSENLYGIIVLDYYKSQETNNPRRIKVDTYYQSVVDTYGWEDTSPSIESLLTNSTDAQTMADAKALEFSTPIQTLEVVLLGERFFSVELYNIMQLDTAPGRIESYTGDFDGRENYGLKIGQVISIMPDYRNLTTTVKLRILPDRAVPNYSRLAYADGTTNIASASGSILRRGGF